MPELVWIVIVAAIAVSYCVSTIPDIIRAQAEAKCQHSLTSSPVIDEDDDQKQIGAILACSKCGMIKKVNGIV